MLFEVSPVSSSLLTQVLIHRPTNQPLCALQRSESGGTGESPTASSAGKPSSSGGGGESDPPTSDYRRQRKGGGGGGGGGSSAPAVAQNPRVVPGARAPKIPKLPMVQFQGGCSVRNLLACALASCCPPLADGPVAVSIIPSSLAPDTRRPPPHPLPLPNPTGKWYRAKVLRDQPSRVLVEYQGFNHEGGPVWLAKDAARLWRGSYKGKDWRYLVGDGCSIGWLARTFLGLGCAATDF